MLRLLYLRCQRISDDMFQQFLGDRDSLARAVHRCGRKSAVKRGAKLLEYTVFHQLLAVAAVDLAFQGIYNIGTTVLNSGISMVIFFFVNKIIFPESGK